MPAALRLALEADRAEIRHLAELRLTAVFENPGKKPLSVLIHATPLSHGGYDVEVVDAQGRPADLDGFGMCGTVAPLMEHEIQVVEPGATFRTPVHPGRGSSLKPGSYRIRVAYHAHDSDHHRDSLAPVVVQRLKVFWTGGLQSDWIPLTVVKS